MACSITITGTDICFGLNGLGYSGYLLNRVIFGSGESAKEIPGEAGSIATIVQYETYDTIDIEAKVLSATTFALKVGDVITFDSVDYRLTRAEITYEAQTECIVNLSGRTYCEIDLTPA